MEEAGWREGLFQKKLPEQRNQLSDDGRCLKEVVCGGKLLPYVLWAEGIHLIV